MNRMRRFSDLVKHLEIIHQPINRYKISTINESNSEWNEWEKTMQAPDGSITFPIIGDKTQTITAEERTEYNHKTINRISQLRHVFQQNYEVYSSVFRSLNLILTYLIETAAVDGKGNLLINPYFFIEQLSKEEQAGVVAHEILHIVNNTFSRQKHRYMQLWNIATDCIMNMLLMRDGFKIPDFGIFPDENGDFTYTYKYSDGRKEERTWNVSTWSAERLYNNLEKFIRECQNKDDRNTELQEGQVIFNKRTGQYGIYNGEKDGKAVVTPISREEAKRIASFTAPPSFNMFNSHILSEQANGTELWNPTDIQPVVKGEKGGESGGFPPPQNGAPEGNGKHVLEPEDEGGEEGQSSESPDTSDGTTKNDKDLEDEAIKKIKRASERQANDEQSDDEGAPGNAKSDDGGTNKDGKPGGENSDKKSSNNELGDNLGKPSGNDNKRTLDSHDQKRIEEIVNNHKAREAITPNTNKTPYTEETIRKLIRAGKNLKHSKKTYKNTDVITPSKATAGKSQGGGTDMILNYIENVKPLTDIFREAMSAKTYINTKKMSRRTIGNAHRNRGTGRATPIEGRRERLITAESVGFYIDTSGSMSESDIEMGISLLYKSSMNIMKKLQRQGSNPDNFFVDLGFFDTVCQGVVRLSIDTNLNSMLNKMQAVLSKYATRGGTEMSAIVKYYIKHKLPAPKRAIYWTDGGVESNITMFDRKKTSTLVALTINGSSQVFEKINIPYVRVSVR